MAIKKIQIGSTAHELQTRVGLVDGLANAMLHLETLYTDANGITGTTPPSITVANPADYGYFIVETSKGTFTMYQGRDSVISGGTVTCSSSGHFYIISAHFVVDNSNTSQWSVLQNCYYDKTSGDSWFTSPVNNTIYKIIGVKYGTISS